MSSQKNKGDGFERELSKYFNNVCGLSSYRTPLSGGGRVGLTPTADLTGTPEMFIEAKRVEKLNFHAALAQAEANRTRSNLEEEITVVINRRNRMTTGESLCLLRLDDLLRLYRPYLISQGYVKESADD